MIAEPCSTSPSSPTRAPFPYASTLPSRSASARSVRRLPIGSQYVSISGWRSSTQRPANGLAITARAAAIRTGGETYRPPSASTSSTTVTTLRTPSTGLGYAGGRVRPPGPDDRPRARRAAGRARCRPRHPQAQRPRRLRLPRDGRGSRPRGRLAARRAHGRPQDTTGGGAAPAGRAGRAGRHPCGVRRPGVPSDARHLRRPRGTDRARSRRRPPRAIVSLHQAGRVHERRRHRRVQVAAERVRRLL
jgi:hypothetical protein